MNCKVELNLPFGVEHSSYLYHQMVPEELHQSLFFATLPNGYSIESGWFPENDPTGSFVVEVSDEQNEPVRKIECETVGEVVQTIERLAKAFNQRLVLSSESSESFVSTTL